MNKPKHYELKKWLCENTVKGLVIHRRIVNNDESETYWELIPTEGKSKKVKDNPVSSMVQLRPDWVRVLSVLGSIKREVDEYKQFSKFEAKDLAEYERLKKKFN